MKRFLMSRNGYSAFVGFMAAFMVLSVEVASGSSGGESGGGGLISIDSSLIIQIINFIFLIWVLNLLLYKPIRNILSQRKEKMDGLEQKIETLGLDAQQKESSFVNGIKEARVRGVKEKEALMQAAQEEERKIIEQINQRSQAHLAEVREKIAQDAQAARTALQQEIDGFAEAIGQKILGRAV